MPRNPTTGVFTLASNSFSDPINNTIIDPVDADATWDDLVSGLNTSIPLAPGAILVGQTGSPPAAVVPTGDVTISEAGVTAIGAAKVTSAMLNADVFSTPHTWSGQQTFVAPILGTPASVTLTNATGLPVTTGISGLGTGIAAALGVNVGTAGSVVVNGGTLGTPSSGTLTNATGLPIATGVSGLAANVATFLATPSSANLRAALTDEVGTGAAYFVGGALGTPASGTATNLTGLPLGGLATQGAFTFVGNNTSGSATPTAVDIAALTTKASPAAGDYVILSDQAASGAWKKATVSSVGSAGSVSSIAGNTGAFTLGVGITNSTNQIRLSLTNATLLGTPANPAGTASVSGVMMGLGSTCAITPVYSNRLRVTFDGAVSNNVAGNTTTLQVRYGTGAAPSNGAALTGTAVGASLPYGNGTSISSVPFSKTVIITGLSPGTAYWLDLVLVVSANTGTLTGITCSADEF